MEEGSVIGEGGKLSPLTLEEALDIVSISAEGEGEDYRYYVSSDNHEALERITADIPGEFGVVVTSSSGPGTRFLTLRLPTQHRLISYMGDECAAPVIAAIQAIQKEAGVEEERTQGVTGLQSDGPVLGG